MVLDNSFEEYLNTEQKCYTKVEDYFPPDSIGILCGDSGSYKTFLDLDIALSTACGIPWNGCETEQGFVAFLSGDRAETIGRRVAIWKHHKKIKVEKGSIIYCDRSAISYNQKPETIVDPLEGLSKPKLVILDNLEYKFKPGVFENLINLIRDRFKCCVLVADLWNSTEIKVEVDFEYHVEKLSKLLVRMTCTRMKHVEPPEPIFFRGKVISMGDHSFDSLIFTKESNE